MNRINKWMLLLALINSIILCSAKLGNSFGRESMEVKVADATSQFGLNFLENLMKPRGNVVISPLSIQNLMNMILLGSNDRSATQEELNKVLGYSDHTELYQDRLKPHEGMQGVFKSIESSLNQGVNFSLANIVMTNEDKITLNEDYTKELEQYYDIEHETFSRPNKNQMPLHERVNNWANNKTQGQINEIVGESDLKQEDLIMILANAAYFKGRWLNPFNPKRTEEKQFFNKGKDATKAKFMRKQDRYGFVDFTPASSREEQGQAELSKILNCSALELPFNLNDGQELSMVFLLPAKRDGLPELEAALDTKILNDIYKSIRTRRVHVELPRFSFDSSFDAGQTLTKMGLKTIFTDSAQLDRMCRSRSGATQGAKLDKVVHKAKITVDESGAEAAAVSVAQIVQLASFEFEPPRFIADHPFLFILRHIRTNMPLFMGRVNSL